MSSNMVVGVIPPPTGLTPNFDNPPSLAPMTAAVTITLVLIASIFVGLRGYTVLFIMRARGIADYLLGIAWLLAVLCSVSSCVMIHFGLGRHFWDVPFSVYNAKYYKVGAIMGTFYGMSVMFTKLSILYFYLNFVLAHPRLRTIIYAVMVIIVLYSLVTSFEWIYACQPLEKYWDLTITEGSCVNVAKFAIFSSVMNVMTDTVILLLPIGILKDLQHLPSREKIAVTGILMTGGLVVCISIIRAKISVGALFITDITWESAPIILWWMAEMDISIICACLVSLKPLLRKHFPRLLGSPHRHIPNRSVNLERLTVPSIANRDLLSSRGTDKVSPGVAIMESAAGSLKEDVLTTMDVREP